MRQDHDSSRPTPESPPRPNLLPDEIAQLVAEINFTLDIDPPFAPTGLSRRRAIGRAVVAAHREIRRDRRRQQREAA